MEEFGVSLIFILVFLVVYVMPNVGFDEIRNKW
jgi:hypothetical protein